MPWTESNLTNKDKKTCEEILELMGDPNQVANLVRGIGEAEVKKTFKELVKKVVTPNKSQHIGFCRFNVQFTHLISHTVLTETWLFAALNDKGAHTESICSKWILNELNKKLNVKLNYPDVLESKCSEATLKSAKESYDKSASVKKDPRKYAVTQVEITWVLQKVPCAEDCNSLVNKRWRDFTSKVLNINPGHLTKIAEWSARI